MKREIPETIKQMVLRHAERQRNAIQLAMVCPISVDDAAILLELLPSELIGPTIRRAIEVGIDQIEFAAMVAPFVGRPDIH